MKKAILMISCLTTIPAHGMETTNTFSIVHHTTTINLTKGSQFDADGKVDCIVVGRNQQRLLQKPDLDDSLMVGEIDYRYDRIIYEKNENSASDDDTYMPWTNNKKGLWRNTHQKKMVSSVMRVIEPRIMITEYYDEEEDECIEDFDYHAQKLHPEKQNRCVSCQTLGVDALKDASLDLIQCYFAVLNERLRINSLTDRFQKLNTKKEMSIALPALSTDVGFPREQAAPFAVAAILQFIKDFPNAYDRIELFVKKRSEFELYKNILMQYAENK